MTALSGKIFKALPVTRDRLDHVGRRLCEARRFAGLTQQDLAQRLGIHRSAISRIENRSDLKVSIIGYYLQGLGARLMVNAHFDPVQFLYRDDIGFDFVPVDDDQLVFPILGDDGFPDRRDVIFSIKPHYSRKIEIGEKTVELRRRFPADVPEGTVALIYSTSPTRALTGIAEIERVVISSPDAIWQAYAGQACIERADFDAYFAGVDRACAIKLRRARPLRRHLALTELRERFSFEPPQSYLYAKPDLREALRYECSQISHRY